MAFDQIKIIQEKNYAGAYIKFFIVSWLAFVALSPYFLISFAISIINIDLGFSIFNYLFSFVGFPSAISVVLILYKKETIKVNSIKEFIAINAKKVFFIGVIIFYLILVLSVLIKISNIIQIIMNVVFSFFAFPVLFLMLNLGYKFFDKTKEVINKDILPESTLQDKGSQN